MKKMKRKRDGREEEVEKVDVWYAQVARLGVWWVLMQAVRDVVWL